MLEIHLLTLFPDAVEAYLGASILGRARAGGSLRVHVLDFRRFAADPHRSVDDRPYGGGPGMVLKAEPVVAAVEWVEREFGPCHRVLLTPDGQRFTQAHALELSRKSRVLLLCARYEGFDERIRAALEWQELSLGDFVLCGGEIAALAVVEAAARLLPGGLGDPGSAAAESFSASPQLLDHPHYTRPAEFRGLAVPEVLRSGHHGAVARWRADQARERTRARRPDLAAGAAPRPAAPVTPGTLRPPGPGASLGTHRD